MNKIKMQGILLIIISIFSGMALIEKLLSSGILPSQLGSPVLQIPTTAATLILGTAKILETLAGRRRLENIAYKLQEDNDTHKVREKIILKFIKSGVIKEKDIVNRSPSEALITVFHYGRRVSKEIKGFYQDGKDPVRTVLRELGFHQVGYKYSYFYDAIREEALPKALRKVANLERYIKAKSEDKWNTVMDNIKRRDPIKFERLRKNSSTDLRISFLVAKIPPYNLKLDFLNSSSFDNNFLSHFLTYKDSLRLETDKRKLEEFMYGQSIEIFLDKLSPKIKKEIIRNESTIREMLEISKITDYRYIAEDQWKEILREFLPESEIDGTVRKILVEAKEIGDVLEDFII